MSVRHGCGTKIIIKALNPERLCLSKSFTHIFYSNTVITFICLDSMNTLCSYQAPGDSVLHPSCAGYKHGYRFGRAEPGTDR